MSAGFRVLASDLEYTDILYDPAAENLTITRGSSSLIKSCESSRWWTSIFSHQTAVLQLDGTDTELAKLKLWNTLGSSVKTMNLTVYVDNSVIEVYANDEVAITTRVYVPGAPSRPVRIC